MFKLLPIILSVVVFSAAYSEVQSGIPGERNSSLLSGGKSTQLSSSLSAQSQNANSISSENDSAETGNGAAAEEQKSPLAPASVTRATSPPSTSSLPPSSIAAARSSSLLSSVLKSSPGIQHHILPAQTIPLPITISTRPGLRTVIAPETITIQEPTIAKVGEVVQKIPTSVSHQSQTIVHNHARVVTPIVAPAVRTLTQQVVRAYHTPLVFAPQPPVVRVLH